MASYSNMQAMRALIKASLQAMFKSPSAIVFTIAFPLSMIIVFGFLRSGSSGSIRVAPEPGSDTTSPAYLALRSTDAIKWVATTDTGGVKKLLQQGDVAATMYIKHQAPGIVPEYLVTLNGSPGDVAKTKQLETLVATVLQQQDPVIRKLLADKVQVQTKIAVFREYKQIDFILPGQLSFSLLASGVFGTAFVFFNLRQTLVLKRFFATPVRKYIIVLAEGIARVIFQIMGSVIIILVGHFVFGFTLAHGVFTFINMLLMCALGLLIFMGFGFIVSALAKSESTIPPLANMITLPQFLLGGTFFSADNFPAWLRPICKVLPLTYMNDALRKISFDGAGLWDVRMEILILLVWGALIYLVAGKLFKWE